jgi:AcrR family transcriptional regulator
MSAEARRGSILEAARSAFVTSGFAGTRTRDIAARAGVNEALLFRHFANKEAIFEEAVVVPLLAIMGTSVGPEMTAATGDEPPDELARKYAATQSTMRRMLEVMQRAVPLLGVVLFAENDRAKALYREQITPILDAGAVRLRRNYGTWAHRPFDPDLMARASTGMCLFIALDAHFSGVELDLDATADELARIIMYGSVERETPNTPPR